MIALFLDPHGENVFKKIKSQATIMSTTSGRVIMHNISAFGDEDEITVLKKKVVSLENKLKRRETSFV